MTWFVKLIGRLLGLKPFRTAEDVARELVIGLEDGSIILVKSLDASVASTQNESSNVETPEHEVGRESSGE